VQRHQSAERPILCQISSLIYPKIQRSQVIMNVLIQVVCGRSSSRLQFSEGGSKMVWLHLRLILLLIIINIIKYYHMQCGILLVADVAWSVRLFVTTMSCDKMAVSNSSSTANKMLFYCRESTMHLGWNTDQVQVSVWIQTTELHLLRWSELSWCKLSLMLANAHYSCPDNTIGLVAQCELSGYVELG